MAKHFTLPYDGGLIDKNLPQGILHSYEKIWTYVFPESRPASYEIADLIVNSINAHRDGLFRLGLTTGNTPTSLYNELARRCHDGKVSFKNVEIVSIDEYYPSSKDEAQSRNHLLHEALLDKVDILKENIHIPDGTVPQENVSNYCVKFDAMARGLDLLVIGVGEQGQVGFNESGSNEKTRTRVVRLSYASRKRQADNFNNDISATPDKAITMGISTMMSAKKIILMAWGEDKAPAVKAITEGPQTTDCPASLLQDHDHISFYVDEAAASLLTRSEAPWLVGPCDWTPKFIRKAVVWLCEVTGKPILKLTEKDYLNNNLSELLEVAGPFDKININVFNDLQHTITGWPGGKPNADDSTRPVKATPFPKTVLIFSPHPDDDVISMGGTFIRLVTRPERGGATVDRPAHFTDPSGQRAITHASMLSEPETSFCSPCANGTPNVTGCADCGALPTHSTGTGLIWLIGLIGPITTTFATRTLDCVVRKPNQPCVSGWGSL